MTVEDENDSPPVFPSHFVELHVSEDAVPPRLLHIFAAQDPDEAGSLYYSLVAPVDSHFYLDSKTGEKDVNLLAA